MSPLQGYGGYLALMMLKSTEKLISCAAVHAPVTDWSMYGEQEFESSLIQRSRDAEIFITSAAAAEPGSSFLRTQHLYPAQSFSCALLG